jgi:RNA polymerase subunit RPABC4/transcription elongation factor Spt4
MAETKQCPKCDAVIATTETKCPACGVDLEELENAIATVEAAQAVIEKRRKATPQIAPPIEPASRKRIPWTSLGAALRKRQP